MFDVKIRLGCHVWLVRKIKPLPGEMPSVTKPHYIIVTKINKYYIPVTFDQNRPF